MALPNNRLSTSAVPSVFLPPRNSVRFSRQNGLSDVHYGGIAIGDASHGVSYQLWTCYSDGTNIWIEAPNTPASVLIPNVGAAWVGLAFDQNARVFVAFATASGVASYYWFDSTIGGYRISALSGTIPRVFAALDDSRPLMIQSSDIILAYVRSKTLYMRVQRDRFGVEYTLGAAPGTLVQIGMSHGDRFQFAFQNVQSNSVLPPAEWNPGLGFNEPA